MLEHYLNLVDECILLTYWKEKHQGMLLTLETMKKYVKQLKGVR